MKVASSRDPYQVQSPVVLGSANLEVNFFLPWAVNWYWISGG